MGLGDFLNGLLRHEDEPRLLPEEQAKQERLHALETKAAKRAQAIEALPQAKDKTIAKLVLEIVGIANSPEEARSLIKSDPGLRKVTVFGKNHYLGLSPSSLSPQLLAFFDNPEVGIASFEYGTAAETAGEALPPEPELAPKDWDKPERPPAITPEAWVKARRQPEKGGKKRKKITAAPVSLDQPLFDLDSLAQKISTDFYKSESKFYRAIVTRLVRPDVVAMELDSRFAKKDVNYDALKSVLTGDVSIERVKQIYDAAQRLGKTRVTEAIDKIGMVGLRDDKVIISAEASEKPTLSPQDKVARVKKAEAEGDLELYGAIFYKLTPEKAAALLVRKSQDGELDEEKFAAALFANKTPARAKSAVLDIIDELLSQGETQLAESIAGFDYPAEPSLGDFLDDYIKQKTNTTPPSEPPAAPAPKPEPQPERRHTPEPPSKQQEFYRAAVEQSPDVAVQILDTKVTSGKLDTDDLAASLAHDHSADEIESIVRDLALAALAHDKKSLARTLLTDLDFAEQPEIAEHLLEEYESLGGDERFVDKESLGAPAEEHTNIADDAIEHEVDAAEYDRFNRLLDEVADSFGESAPAAPTTPTSKSISAPREKFDYKTYLAEERAQAAAEAAAEAPTPETKAPEPTKVTTEKRVDTLIAEYPEKLVDLLESGELTVDTLTAVLSRKRTNESAATLQTLISTAVHTERETLAEKIADIAPAGRQDIRDINTIFLIGELQQANKISDPTLYLDKISDPTLRTEARKRLYGGKELRDDSTERLDRLVTRITQRTPTNKLSDTTKPAAATSASEEADFAAIMAELEKTPPTTETIREPLTDEGGTRFDFAKQQEELRKKAKEDATQLYEKINTTDIDTDTIAKLIWGENTTADLVRGIIIAQELIRLSITTGNEGEIAASIIDDFCPPDHDDIQKLLLAYFINESTKTSFPADRLSHSFKDESRVRYVTTAIEKKREDNSKTKQVEASADDEAAKMAARRKEIFAALDAKPVEQKDENKERVLSIVDQYSKLLTDFPNRLQALAVFRVYMGGNKDHLTQLFSERSMPRLDTPATYVLTKEFLLDKKNKPYADAVRDRLGKGAYKEFLANLPESEKSKSFEAEQERTPVKLGKEELGDFFPATATFRSKLADPKKADSYPEIRLLIAAFPGGCRFEPYRGGIKFTYDEIPDFSFEVFNPKGTDKWVARVTGIEEKPKIREIKPLARFPFIVKDFANDIQDKLRKQRHDERSAAKTQEQKERAEQAERKLTEFATALTNAFKEGNPLRPVLENAQFFSVYKKTDANGLGELLADCDAATLEKLKNKISDGLENPTEDMDDFINALPDESEVKAAAGAEAENQAVGDLRSQVAEFQSGRLDEKYFRSTLAALSPERRDKFLLEMSGEIAQASPHLLAELLPDISDEGTRQTVMGKIIRKLNLSQEADWDLARDMLRILSTGGTKQESTLRLLVTTMVKGHELANQDDWNLAFDILTYLDPENPANKNAIKDFVSKLFGRNADDIVQTNMVRKIFHYLSKNEGVVQEIMHEIIDPATVGASSRAVNSYARRVFQDVFGHPYEARARRPDTRSGGRPPRRPAPSRPGTAPPKKEE